MKVSRKCSSNSKLISDIAFCPRCKLITSTAPNEISYDITLLHYINTLVQTKSNIS